MAQAHARIVVCYKRIVLREHFQVASVKSQGLCVVFESERVYALPVKRDADGIVIADDSRVILKLFEVQISLIISLSRTRHRAQMREPS